MDICIEKFKLIGYGEVEMSMDGGFSLSLSRSMSKTARQNSIWDHPKQEQDGNSIHVGYCIRSFNQSINHFYLYHY